MGAEEGGMVDYDENAAVTIVALPTLFFNDEQPKWLHVHNSPTQLDYQQRKMFEHYHLSPSLTPVNPK